MPDTREQPPPSPASLRGMERSVRTLPSFVRTTPPPSSSHSHKPLPPMPIYGRTIFNITPAPMSPPSDRTSDVTSWKAPATWDDRSTPYEGLHAPTPFSNRSYAPLLPEPTSPGVFEQLNSSPLSSNLAAPQAPGLSRREDSFKKIP